MIGQEVGSKGLVSMLYRSEATEPFAEMELYDLADSARERNHRRQVTGALYYEQGKFFQWLEGPRDTVSTLFEKIGRDPRHENVELVSIGPIQTRAFEDWDLRLFRERQQIPYRMPLADPCDHCHSTCKPAQVAAGDLSLGSDRSLYDALVAATGQHDAQVCFMEKVLRGFAWLWENDQCLPSEIVCGQALALSTYRQVVAATSNVFPYRDRKILVSPLPGAPHYLRAALATAVLVEAGFPTTCLPAATEADLADELRRQKYAGLVLVAGDPWLGSSADRQVDALCRQLLGQFGESLQTAVYGQLPTESRRLLGSLTGPDRLCSTALRLPDIFTRRDGRAH